MTELYIDSMPVVLPRSLNIQVIEENPFFTKNGKYTLDITLSLEESENAKIYRHLQRINVIDMITLNRRAQLIVDNEVVLNGTEVILEHTDSQVKIQLVSGNSELNFLIGGDRKLRDLDLGKAYIYDDLPGDERVRRIFEDLKQSYPERDWQLIPYCAGEGDVNIYPFNWFIHVGNNFTLTPIDMGDGNGEQINPFFVPFASGSIPQPYLCFIIRKVLESLGYNLTYNAIELHPVLKDLYIVHGISTQEFAKMLPQWTVVEFFTKIEQWLNCEFIINPYEKSVKLMFNYQADDEETGTVTLEILDEYSTENGNEDDKNVTNANVAYSLDTEDYYKYMYLDRNIRDKAELDRRFQFLELIDFNRIVEIGYQYIFQPTDTNDRFISYLIDEEHNMRTLKKVDSFRPLYNAEGSNEIDIELDIIPAAMKYTYIVSTEFDLYWLQIPIAGSYDPLLDVDDPDNSDPDNNPVNIQSMVESEASSTADIAYSKMRLALYSGLKEVEIHTNNSGKTYPINRYPIAYVEALAEYFQETNRPYYFGQKDVNPFRLDYLNSEIYSKSQRIDTTKTYKLQYTDQGRLDITSKFIANNKAFRCVRIERSITIDGFSEIVRGDFYSYNN